jgi:aminopeptidase
MSETTPATADLLARYADVVARVGVNVQPGQLVSIRGLVEHAEFARAIAEACYAAGAGRVEVDYADDFVRHSGIAHGASARMAEVCSVDLAVLDRLEAEGAALVRLSGNPHPELFDDLDPAAVVAAEKRDLAQRSREVLMGGRVSWNIVAAPNPGWARAVLGEPDVDRLWELVATAVRLSDPDPVQSWRDHLTVLARRAAHVEGLELDALHYEGPGTDLTIGLHPGGRWMGGAMGTSAGVVFAPNLPTEEVFSSPDPQRADGVIALTRPLMMPSTGILVEGLTLTFEGGRIVDATASRGQEAVLAELDSHPNARRLGEVALVDRTSRVREAGVIFHDTLYDENAGAHLAWGQAFPFAMPDAATPEMLNTAPVHTDVVVGGPGVSITGVTADGARIPLIVDDLWALA